MRFLFIAKKILTHFTPTFYFVLRTDLLLPPLQEKQDQLKQFSGEEILRGEEFKNYINNLRTKSSFYKLKRAELSDLRAEYGVLSRTQEILRAKEAQINDQLVSNVTKKHEY